LFSRHVDGRVICSFSELKNAPIGALSCTKSYQSDRTDLPGSIDILLVVGACVMDIVLVGICLTVTTRCRGWKVPRDDLLDRSFARIQRGYAFHGGRSVAALEPAALAERAVQKPIT